MEGGVGGRGQEKEGRDKVLLQKLNLICFLKLTMSGKTFEIRNLDPPPPSRKVLGNGIIFSLFITEAFYFLESNILKENLEIF